MLAKLTKKNIYLLYKNLTIRSKIIISFIIIISLFVVLNLVLIINSFKFTKQYDKFVNNIVMANEINDSFKTDIDNEMWNIVAGKIKFEEGNQYNIINRNINSINNLKNNVTTNDNKIRLDVIIRTIDTLVRYIDEIDQENKMVDEKLEILESVRGVSSLIEDDLQEFMVFELKESDKLNSKMQRSYNMWIMISIIVLSIVLIFSILAIWIISGNISKPINNLCKTTTSIAEGNFNIRIESNSSNEIDVLVKSFNIMIVKIKELMEKSKKEQEQIKKSELKVLQAQIKPHFLYNTLEAIVWMTELNKKEEVKKIVIALASFFRVSLSKGEDFITIEKEIEHIESYLTIQKIRYRDILNYNISVDKNIYEYKVLKLMLQPLVENAIYHGIKYRESGGYLELKGFIRKKLIIFEIIDNGQGMTEKKHFEIEEILKKEDNKVDDSETNEGGFGLNNVHKRIQLYYGKSYGLHIISKFGKGTKVLVCIPLRE